MVLVQDIQTVDEGLTPRQERWLADAGYRLRIGGAQRLSHSEPARIYVRDGSRASASTCRVAVALQCQKSGAPQ